MKWFGVLSLIGLVALQLACVQAWTKKYNGYQVLEVIPKDKNQADMLHQLEIHDQVDMGGAMVAGSKVKVTVAPENLVRVKADMALAGLEHTVFIEDVQQHFDAEESWAQKKLTTRNYDANDFNTYDDILDEMNRLVRSCAAGVECSTYSTGKSYEGRDILVFTIRKAGTSNPVVWLDSTVHAREWLSTATVLRIMDHLVSEYGLDDEVTGMVDNYEWHLMAVANPDGYIYSWTNDRLWRKNRRPNAGTSCYGTDLNRNYDFKWGLEGVSTRPCSDIYCGPSPASEPETKAVQNAVLALSKRMMAFVTFHAFGYMWMFPWGYTEGHNGYWCARTDDYDDLMEVADATANAVMRTYNDDYWLRGTSCEVIYETSGASDDWAKGEAGVKYTFNPELRGSWFVVPRSDIEPSFRETFNGIVAMVKRIDAKEGWTKATV